MNRHKRLIWMAVGGALVIGVQVLIVGLARIDVATRPAAPPETAKVPYPWGAIDLSEVQAESEVSFEASLEESMRQESADEFDADEDGVRTYPILALSGGGSNGAFGTGFLSGWSASGTRPEFKIVTGVSTGSLQATFAFLGSEYDDELRQIYSFPTERIHKPGGLFAPLFNDAIKDTAPLAELIRTYASKEVIEAVAEKHRRGYRLYVGTTNMDAGEFVIWDMGKIAASGRPDAVALYRNVLLASSAVPVLFPPVYFKVDMPGNELYEMHVDGSAYAQVFFRGFLLEFDDAMDNMGLSPASARVVLYVIRNGNLEKKDYRKTVAPRTISIATATIESLFKITITAGLYRMYVLANRYGIDFNLAYLPADIPESDPVDFDQKGMKRSYDAGFRLASEGYEWHKHLPGLDPDERFE